MIDLLNSTPYWLRLILALIVCFGPWAWLCVVVYCDFFLHEGDIERFGPYWRPWRRR